MRRFVCRVPRSVGLVVLLVLALGVGALVGRATTADATASSGERPVLVALAAPVRYLDTRPSPYGPTGIAPAAPLGAGATITVAIAGVTRDGVVPVPLDATAVQVNVTAVNATNDTFVTAFAAGAPRPNASTLNPFPDRITFNGAVVDLGVGGAIALYNNAGTVDLIVDVVGYYVDHDHDDRYERRGAGSITVPGAAFQASEADDWWIGFDHGGCVYGEYDGPGPLALKPLHAPLVLPAGVHLTGMRVTFRDSSATDATLDLKPGTHAALLSAASSGNAGEQTVEAMLATPHTVAAGTPYFLTFRPAESGSGLQVCSVEVLYTTVG